MHKLLISLTVLSTLTLAGCGSMGGLGDAIPEALDDWSLMYRPNIQQGNVVTQEMMDKLELGMDKRQVRYALGTPMLVDVFHQDRWDYVYTFGRGSTPREFKRTALFFEADRLVRIEGELQPRDAAERPESRKEVLVSVPDYEAQDLPFFQRALNTVGIGKDD
jgi:outer membrane protein assembly factor BamE